MRQKIRMDKESELSEKSELNEDPEFDKNQNRTKNQNRMKKNLALHNGQSELETSPVLWEIKLI